jgi:predicted CopG family antitoxin
MSRTSIPVDDSTKKTLDKLKREGETWDEFLTRVTRDEEPIEFGSWSEDEADEAMDRLREGRERPE